MQICTANLDIRRAAYAVLACSFQTNRQDGSMMVSGLCSRVLTQADRVWKRFKSHWPQQDRMTLYNKKTCSRHSPRRESGSGAI